MKHNGLTTQYNAKYNAFGTCPLPTYHPNTNTI